MSDNPFAIENIRAPEAQEDDNPFSLAVIQRRQQAEVKLAARRAVAVKPDDAAEALNLSKRYPAPPDVLMRQLDAVRPRAEADALVEALQSSPILAERFRVKPLTAAMARDDVGTLAKLEQFATNLGGTTKAGVYGASRGIAGTFRAAFELAAPALDVLEPVTAIGGNPLRRLAEGFDMVAAAAGATADAAMPKAEGNVASGFYSGVRSLTQNALMLPLAFLPGGQAAALAGMSAVTGGDAYQKAREQNLPMAQALPFAVSQAAIEYATEKIPLGALLKDVGVGAGFLKVLGRQIALEVPGEQIATVLQDMNEWAVLPENAGKPFSAYLAERPDAAAQTLVATIVGTGGNVAVAKGVEAATQRVQQMAERRQQEAQAATEDADNLKDMLTAAGQSLLRQRSPEEFRAYLQTVTDKSLYVEGAMLAQLPPDALAALPEAVREQIAVESQRGGFVEIPVADALTVAPGTVLEQTLVEHGKTDPFALSQTEAKQAGERAALDLQTEAARVIAEAQDADAMQASADRVRETITSELTAAGRYSPRVSEQMATWASAFYTTMASRTGVTPEEFFQKYRLRILGEPSQGGAQAALDTAQLGQVPAPALADGYQSLALGDSTVEVTVKDGHAAISMVKTPEDKRGQGSARKAMAEVLRAADAQGLIVTLTPEPMDRKTSKAKLEKFYRSLGFAPNKGRNKDFRYSGAMIRPPQALEQRANRGPLGTFNPVSLELVLSPHANLSTFFHETGHFFLEVLADIGSRPDAPADLRDMWGETLRWFGIKGDETVGVEAGSGEPLAQVPAPEGVLTDEDGQPLVLYHGTTSAFDKFARVDGGNAYGTGHYFTTDPAEASGYAEGTSGGRVRPEGNAGPNVLQVYTTARNVFALDNRRLAKAEVNALEAASNTLQPGTWAKGEVFKAFDRAHPPTARNVMQFLTEQAGGTYTELARAAGFDALRGDYGYVVFDPKQIVSATSGEVLGQGQEPPALGPLPARRTPQEVWAAMTLEEKRPYHERWAESVEQYIMEGKAPSKELQPLMRRFAQWLKQVYGSIQRFLAMRGALPAQGGETLGQVDAEAQREAVYREIAQDDEAVAALELWMTDGAQPSREVNDRLLAYMRRLPPVPTDSYLTFYRGQPRNAKPHARGWASWTTNRDETRFFTDSADSEVLQRKGARGLNLEEVGLWRTRLTGERHDYGSQGEWLLLNDSVFTQGAQPQNPAAHIQLNDDIRRVMDRLLATDAQIAEAEEIAGMVPDVDATGEAAERLRKRSMRDLAWTVRVRDKAIRDLQRQRDAEEKRIREEATAEVDAMPEARAIKALDALAVATEYDGKLAEWKAKREEVEAAARGEVTAHTLDAEAAKGNAITGLAKGPWLSTHRKEVNNKVEARVIEWERANRRPLKARYATEQDLANVADSFPEGGWSTVDEMLQAVAAFDRRDLIDGMTDKRMLEEHGDLIDERAIREAANEAVHNEARARALATELRTQQEMLGERADTGQTNARGARVTVSVIAEAAKQFAANVVGRTPIAKLRSTAWQHTAAERRAANRWQDATAAGETEEAVAAKRDQVLQNAAARAAQDAQAEVRKTLDFFKRVAKGNDETVVEKGRDPDIANAARAVLAAYGVETPTTKAAAEYMRLVQRNDPDTHAAIAPAVEVALANAQPLDSLTVDELQALRDSVDALWHLAKRTRQSEVDGKLLDRQDLADELFARMEEVGIPDTVPGEGKAVTKAEARALFLRQGVSFLRRVEQWAEGMDGKYGGPFLRYVFQPVKDAADAYRRDRAAYRKKLQALVDNIAPIVKDQVIDAPELGYKFGAPGSTRGTAMNEILHAILHTGNDSNKRKLLLGRGWATELPDGTMDTTRWDAFIARLVAEGKLQREHFDFVQGVWDLLEETKPLAQKAHRDALGRYFAEVTADPFIDPFGVERRGGYAPAIVDPDQVKDNELRKLAEAENESMAYAFPAPGKGFTKSRVEDYTRPLLLDLRTVGQHLDKVLLFSHMTVPAQDVRRLLTDRKVSQPLTRIDPSAVPSMLQPWLQRSAQQVVETPIPGAGKWARIPSVIRARAGAALMFANVSNAIQQVTGLSTALVKVKPSFMLRAVAQHVAHPTKAARAVWETSAYMDDRARNEIAVLTEQMQDILVKPSVYEKAQAWSMRHAYFLQTAIDNALSPIVWTGAYNQAMAEGMDHDTAVKFADGTVRQTQGSTLPEDVSRLETGPAYARAFTQFIGYFNMVANTNGTALKQIADEVGLKRGAGRAFSVVMLGLLVPIWAAEAIALAFKGGPDDEDDDGYLDDWLAAVFGFGTVKGMLAMIPIAGQAANSAVTRLDNNPMNDRISLSPGLSLLESALGGNVQTAYEILNEDKEVNARRAVRDAATLVSVFTGLPFYAAARPAGYLAGIADDKIEPTGPADFARGLVTGTASPESKQR